MTADKLNQLNVGTSQPDLSEVSPRRYNNFDGLRIAAALAVIVGHSLTLTGIGVVPRIAGIPLHTLGVYVFFSISGFLISKSWAADPSWLRFLAKRGLRIFPALILVVVISFLAIGPIASTLTSAAYFADGRSWSYLSSVSLIPQYELPGVFKSNPETAAVNGSLWTLGLEFLCYVIVAALGSVPRRIPPYVLSTAFAVAMATFATLPESIVGSWAHQFGVVSTFFAVACILGALPKRPTLRPLAMIAVVTTWLVAGTLFSDFAEPFAWVVLPLLLISIGSRSTPVFRRSARYGDISYGLYLWGFPIQQLVVDRFGVLPFWANLSITVSITTAIALVSWHVVEKNALKMKPRPTVRGRPQLSPMDEAAA